MQRQNALVGFALLTLMSGWGCSKQPTDAVDARTQRESLVVNGDFESDTIGTRPAGWTVEKYLNPGLNVVPPTSFQDLGLADGGGLNVVVVGGATESQTDPQMNASATFRYPKYGSRSVVVNPGNTNVTPSDATPTGRNRSANVLRQSMTVSASDIDPVDGAIHVRFVAAPVLENPTHNPDEQPYFFIQVRNVTRSAVLYSTFNFAGQTGVAWKTGPTGILYTDWQVIDVPTSGVRQGDQLEIIVAAAGCSLGGHFGHVYLDSFGPTIPGLYVIGSAAASAPSNSDLTYTIDYRNSGAATANGTTVTFVTPPNTTYVSNTGGCTGVTAGATGTLTCTIGSLAAGARSTFNVVVHINAGVTGTLTQQNYSIQATGVTSLLGSKIDTLVYTGPATITAFQGTPQSAVVNTDYATALVAEVRDATNAVIPGLQVNWAVPGSGASGSLPVGFSTTDSQGHASMPVHANTVAGAFTATASLPSVATPASFALTNTAGTAAAIAIVSGNNQNANENAAFGAPLVVVVTDQYGNAVPNATVTFAAPGSGASAALSAPAVTNAQGRTQVTATANSFAGAYSVTASVAGVATPATFTLTNNPVASAIVTVSGTPQSQVVGVAYAAPLVAQVNDSHGTPVPGVTVVFTAPSQSGASATLTAPAVTDAQGRAQVTATANTHTGAFSVQASVTGLATPAAFALTNTAGAPAAISVVSGSGQSVQVGGALAPLVVQVVDQFGNVVPGATVTWSAPSSGASAVLGSSAVTDASGRTQVAATANTTAGTYQVTASVAGVALPATFTLTNTAGAAAIITAVSGGGQSTTVSTAFAAPLVVRVTDTFGNVVAGASVTFTPPASGARATLSAPAVTNAQGLTQVTATAGTVSGAYSVNATLVGVTTPATFALTNTAGAATLITAVSGGGQSAVVATAFAAPLVVRVTDTFGNVVPGVSVTFTPPASGARASLSAPAVTNAQGLTQVTATAGTVSGAYSVNATVAGVATPATFALTNTAGAAAIITVVSGGGQSTVVSTAFASPLVVRVTDAFGNVVAGASVTFTPPASGATASLTSPIVTDAQGLTQVSATAGTVSGAFSVDATLAGVSTPATFALTNTSGAAALITAVSGGGQSAVISTAFAAPLVVRVTDTLGNVVAGASVMFTAPASGARATLSSPAVTDAQGLTQVNATAGTVMGGYSVSATLVGVATPATFALTNTVGAPASIEVVSGGTQSTPRGHAFGQPLVVVVKDAGGNVVPGATVQVTAPSTGASASTSGTLTTDSQGRVSLGATANNVAGGPYDVTVQVSGVAGSAAFHLTNTVGAAAHVVLTSGGDQTAAVTTTYAQPVVFTVTDDLDLPVPDAVVFFSAPQVGASVTLSASSAHTDGQGQVSVSLIANTRAGALQVTATVANLTPASANERNTAGSAVTVRVVSGGGQSTGINTVFGAPLVVEAVDAWGNVVTGATLTWTVPSQGASASLNTQSTTTDSQGRAQVTATANGTTGAYIVSVELPSGQHANFTLINTEADALQIAVVSGTPQSTRVATAFSAPLVVAVTRGASPVANALVAFSAPTSGPSASLSAFTVRTDASGQAQVTATAGTRAGAFAVTASTNGAASSASFALTNQAGAPVAIVADPGSSPQAAQTGTAFQVPLGGTVVDAYGNPVSGVSVTVTVPSTGATGVLGSGSPLTTDEHGHVSMPITAGGTAGSYTAVMTADGVSTSLSFDLVNTAGTVKSIAVVSGSGQSTQVATAFSAGLRVVVRNASGTRLANEVVTFVLGTAAGANATLSATTATTDANGEASVDATANTVAGRYPVLATVTDGAAPARFELTNTPGAPASIEALSASSPQSTRVMTPFAQPLVVTVRDTYGNPIPQVEVVYTAPASTGATATLVASPVRTNADGQTTVSAIASERAGTYEVTATVSGVSTPVHFTLTNLPGEPSTVVIVSGGTQSTPAGSPYPTPVVIEVHDAYGNIVPGAPVTVTVPTSGASATASPSPITTGSDGRATITLTANDTPGSFEVPISTPGGSTPVVVQLNNTAIPTSTTVSSSASTTAQPTTLTATVHSNTGTPGGIVRFYVDGVEVGQGTLVDGIATLEVTGLSPGSHEVVAKYDAQGGFSASESTSTSFDVARDDGSLNGGGGCGCNSSSGVGLLGLLLTPMLWRRRRSRRALSGGVVTLLVALAMPSTSHAQNAVSLNVFHNAPAGSDWFGIDAIDLRGHLRPAARLLFDFGHNPLVVYNADGSTRTIAIANQAFFNLGGSLVIADRVRVNLDLPLAVHSGSFNATFNNVSVRPANQAGLGDLALGADVRLFGVAGSMFTGALGVGLTLPTGAATSFFGDGHVGVTPRFAVAGDVSVFTYSAQLSYAIRTAQLAGVAYGNELRFGLAGGVRLVEKKLLIGPELHGFAPLGGVGDPPRPTGMEVDFGAHYKFLPDWRGSIGVGTGVLRSSGVPDFRLLAAVEWVLHVDEPPPPSDRDHDGILDADDACIDVPGVASTDPTLHGCPDRDRDGVPDEADRCPDVAQGAHPDPKQPGCPLVDTDADGVFDVDDVCPSEPMGATPDPLRKGCPKPPDTDGDGVVDSLDQCPTVPKGHHPDESRPGCPLPDRDGDAIVDVLDACPDTAGAPDADPKKNGCPGLVRIESSKILILEPVRFATNKDVILPESNGLLTAVAQTMTSFPELELVSIDGHTDSQGRAAYNKDLSDRRAKSVMRWLIEHGVEASRLEAHGHGQEEPIDTNATVAGRAKNRRVEFRIIKRKE